MNEMKLDSWGTSRKARLNAILGGGGLRWMRKCGRKICGSYCREHVA